MTCSTGPGRYPDARRSGNYLVQLSARVNTSPKGRKAICVIENCSIGPVPIARMEAGNSSDSVIRSHQDMSVDRLGARRSDVDRSRFDLGKPLPRRDGGPTVRMFCRRASMGQSIASFGLLSALGPRNFSRRTVAELWRQESLESDSATMVALLTMTKKAPRSAASHRVKGTSS